MQQKTTRFAFHCLGGGRRKEALNATTKLILQMYKANLKYALLRAFMKGAPRAVG